MNEGLQFQMMPPQIVPIYGPPSNAFRMPGPPIYPLQTQYGFPPMAWSPVHHYPPLSSPPVYSLSEETDDYNGLQDYTYNDNDEDDVSQNEPQPMPQSSRPRRHSYNRFVANKFDTRHEEFRKYLEEKGILSIFTNILAEMYQDPLRPSDPLEYIREKLNCSRPETVELSNLRLWCDEYQSKTMRLENELKHVIERLKKYEPYTTDDSLFNVISTEIRCKSCNKMDVSKQEHKLVINKNINKSVRNDKK